MSFGLLLWNSNSAIKQKPLYRQRGNPVNPVRDDNEGESSADRESLGVSKMAKRWNFLSNYGLVLTHLVQNPQATLREIARGTDLTERAVYQIVRELEENGFIQKRRVGRRNSYTVNEGALFSFPVYQELNIAQMITALRRMMEEGRVTA